MAEDVVEDVGFLQIVELLRGADEIARGKAPVGEMVEEGGVGYQPRHRDDPPPGRRHQPRVEVAVVGNARLFEPQHVDDAQRSEEHTSELQSLMGISYAVSCLKKQTLLLTKKHTVY